MRRAYLRILSVLYFAAFILHGLDIFDLRLKFTQMGGLARAWTLYLLVGDLLAALSLWRGTVLADLFFSLIVIAQLSVFVCWSALLPNQNFIIAFHWITLTVFLVVLSFRSPIVEAPT